MSFHGYDRNNRGPFQAAYGGGYYSSPYHSYVSGGGYYSSPYHSYGSQFSSPPKAYPPILQLNRCATMINGFPFVPQTHSQLFSPPYLEPIHPIASQPLTTTPPSPSIPTYPNPNLWNHVPSVFVPTKTMTTTQPIYHSASSAYEQPRLISMEHKDQLEARISKTQDFRSQQSPFQATMVATSLTASSSAGEDRNPFNQVMSVSTSSSFVKKQVIGPEDGVEQIQVLPAVDNKYGGVDVELKGDQPLDSEVYTSLLRFSMSQWKQKGKRGVWIKLPIQLSNLVDATVKEGFRYHHAEPDYLMLVHWIPETVDSLPPNASHRVGIGAFVVNSKREVLVVQEANGSFRGTGVWKLPTGVVHEGEDIFAAAVREVKEETGIETEFVEMLAFRHSHKAFFRKSDLCFICMLKPHSCDIQKQDSEIAAAQWMPIEDYAAQPFVKEHKLFDDIAQICLAKLDNDYAGFTSLATTTSTRKTSYLYFNNGKPTNFC